MGRPAALCGKMGATRSVAGFSLLRISTYLGVEPCPLMWKMVEEAGLDLMEVVRFCAPAAEGFALQWSGL